MTTVERRAQRLATLLALGLLACGPGKVAQRDTNDGSVITQPDAADNPETGVAKPSDADPDPDPDPDADTSTDSDAGSAVVPIRMGEVDPNAPPNTGLPALPRLINVKGKAIGDSVSISFDPVEGAVDYRVYELPAQSDVSAKSDGHVTIKNAVYRCAGNRQTPPAIMDGAAQVQSGAVKTIVEQDVVGYRRTLADATLGYVYAEPGDGRVAVYALGERDAKSDNLCFFHRWTASRRKQYVTSTATRDMLLKQGFRDDGIAFYVPAAASGDTRQVLTTADNSEYGARLYFVEGAEATVRKNGTAAFFALAKQSADSFPLMRVHYTNMCGQAHDELVAGKPRFEIVRRQGDKLPLTKLHWSGLTKSTTLVIEALDQGCPFQGLLGPASAPDRSDPTYNTPFPAWVTPEQAQAASPNQELFINGQFDGTNPRPIARTFLKIGPSAAPELDWSFGFKASDALGALADAHGTPIGCVNHVRNRSALVDTGFFCVEPDRAAQRVLFGELWVMFTDGAADTNGKYRITAVDKADLTADSYLYVTMEVDGFSTLRRYPQILISDRDAPIQNSLPQGNTLVLQSFEDWPNSFELQVCNHRNWDVNDQCPKFDFYRQQDPNDANKVLGLAPNVEFGEQVGMDYSNRYEMYVSSKRAYVFLDGQPYGCADLPTAGVPQGAVTVTFGDVLYHSGVDNTFDFTKRKQQTVSLRHFDNLGFKNHVAAPPWDAGRFPCAKHLK
jgi:hypothetical protein